MAVIANHIINNQDTEGMLHRALERIIQLYTDKSHFVYELLQNAEDSEATQIKFVQHDSYLEVFHNGKPFTAENLSGLCDIGKSDKVDDLNQIGEFGVGFKSVYGICDIVKLYSNPSHYKGRVQETAIKFAVQINGFITPEDIEYLDMPAKYTTHFIFPYSTGRNYSGFNNVDSLNNALSNKLRSLGITTLLFMKHLELIEYEIDVRGLRDHGQYALSKEKVNNRCVLVSPSKKTKSKEENNKDISYFVFSRQLSSLESRSVDIAYPVRKNEDNRSFVFEESANPYVSVYFPTETESKLKFIVQGPYRTTPNRSSIPAEDKENMHLADETAVLLRDSLIDLRDLGYLNMSLVKILPFDVSPFYKSPLFKPLNASLKKLFISEKILPTRNNEYVGKDHALITRQEKLIPLLPDEVISDLINDGKDYHWLSSALTETNADFDSFRRFLVGAEMKIEVMRPEDLRNKFDINKSFLPKQSDEWLIELYTVFANIPGSFTKDKGDSSMLNARIVKTSDGDFVAPYRKTSNKQLVPDVFLPSKVRNSKLKYVDEKLYKKYPDFFENILHLKKPDDYEIFVQEFKVRNAQSHSLDLDMHIYDVKQLMKYLRNDEYSDEVRTLIREFSLLCDDGKCRNPQEARIYVPQTELGVKIKDYYKNITDDVFYVDLTFYTANGISERDLTVFGDSTSLIVGETITHGEDLVVNGIAHQWNTTGNFRLQLTLDKLTDALEYISNNPNASDSIFKSQAILLELLNNDIKLQGDVIYGSFNGKLTDETCEALKILCGKNYDGSEWKWIITENMKWANPRSITKKEIPESFYGELKQDSNVYALLGFVKNELNDVEEILSHISQEQRDAYFENELRKRLGMSLSELKTQYNGFTGERSVDNEALQFPTANIRNWDTLKKHAAEMFVYANPTKYEVVSRTIRTSRSSNDSRAYLLGMYKFDDYRHYACQMCHEPVFNVEAVELFNKPDTELDPVNLCLCSNCAKHYRKLRNSNEAMKELRDAIDNYSEDAIGNNDTIEIPISSHNIWFTQIHFAEIKVLLDIENAALDKS